MMNISATMMFWAFSGCTTILLFTYYKQLGLSDMAVEEMVVDATGLREMGGPVDAPGDSGSSHC